jgi:hypothetical protein
VRRIDDWGVMCGSVGLGVGRFIVNCCMVNLCTKMNEDTWRLLRKRELTRTVFAMSLGVVFPERPAPVCLTS